MIATVGTEIFLNYQKKHSLAVDQARRKNPDMVPSKCTKPMVRSIPKKAPAKKAAPKDLKSSIGKRPVRKAPAKKVSPRRK